ncbi:MAG TPA: DUF1330 domain-containing protein [Candidatus Polarisedimenticolia bacterium]
MAGYIIVDVRITDPARYQEYVKAVPATIAAYGGRFLVRGGKSATLEGDWRPGRVVVLEFESAARAREWWDSKEYRALRELRQSASTAEMIVVEGV